VDASTLLISLVPSADGLDTERRREAADERLNAHVSTGDALAAAPPPLAPWDA